MVFMEKTSKRSRRLKDYIYLHLSILLFSFTSVFTKLASTEYNKNGIYGWKLYLFLFLMLLNCFVFPQSRYTPVAIVLNSFPLSKRIKQGILIWQKIISHFELSVAYANKSVYLIWTQVWAVLIFHEVLTIQNIIGLMIVLAGVLVVQKYE